MREVGAVIKKGQALSGFTKEFCIQTNFSFFDKYRSRKKARGKEEGMGGPESKEFVPAKAFRAMPAMDLTFREVKKTTARATSWFGRFRFKTPNSQPKLITQSDGLQDDGEFAIRQRLR